MLYRYGSPTAGGGGVPEKSPISGVNRVLQKFGSRKNVLTDSVIGRSAPKIRSFLGQPAFERFFI